MLIRRKRPRYQHHLAQFIDLFSLSKMIGSHWHYLSDLLSLPYYFFGKDSYLHRQLRSISCFVVQVGQGEIRSFDEVADYQSL